MPPITMTISSRPQIDSRKAFRRSAQLAFGLARVVVAARAVPGRQAEHRRQHDAGNDAGHEQRADRGVGRDRVHHHHDRRRDQDAERAGRRDDAGAEALREPGLAPSPAAGSSRSRPPSPATSRTPRRTARTPARPPSPRPPCQWPTIEVAKLIMRLRDAAVGQEVAGQDEERDRHDLELLDAGEQLQRHRLDRHLGHGEQEREHRQAERDRDRHAGQHQHDQQREDDRRCSSLAVPIAACGARRSADRAGRRSNGGACLAACSVSQPSDRSRSSWPPAQAACLPPRCPRPGHGRGAAVRRCAGRPR